MEATDDIALHRVSAAEQVAQTLMNLIMKGDLRAGQPLREAKLARSLGISRNSVREGVRLLEQSRLVKYEIHRGVVVNTPSWEDIEDLFQTREVLEVSAVSKPADRAGLTRLRWSLDELSDAVRSQDAQDIVAADLAFHASIVALNGSERLDEFYKNVTTELTFYLAVISYTDQEFSDPHESLIEQHKTLLDAVAERDVPLSVQRVRDHIRASRDRLGQIIAGQNEPLESPL